MTDLMRNETHLKVLFDEESKATPDRAPVYVDLVTCDDEHRPVIPAAWHPQSFRASSVAGRGATPPTMRFGRPGTPLRRRSEMPWVPSRCRSSTRVGMGC